METVHCSNHVEKAAIPKQRKPYRKPILKKEGDVRDLTLGSSPGVGDSTNPAIFKEVF